jgi:hypothetical protein
MTVFNKNEIKFITFKEYLFKEYKEFFKYEDRRRDDFTAKFINYEIIDYISSDGRYGLRLNEDFKDFNSSFHYKLLTLYCADTNELLMNVYKEGSLNFAYKDKKERIFCLSEKQIACCKKQKTKSLLFTAVSEDGDVILFKHENNYYIVLDETQKDSYLASSILRKENVIWRLEQIKKSEENSKPTPSLKPL